MKIAGIVLGLFFVLHYGSRLWLTAERLAVGQYEHAIRMFVVNVADARGLSVTVPEPVLSIDEIAEREALRRGINPRLVLAMMHVESRKNRGALSPKGAIGLMQIMPANAKRCGFDGAAQLVPDENNVACGVQIIAEELRNYGDDTVTALQVYNGGPTCVGVCKESVKYAKSVLAVLARDIG